MKNILRLCPERALPDYIFIPGVNPHPKKAGGHMEGLSDPIAPMIDVDHPERSETLRFGLDLHNYGYFWEAHVYMEALWNAHGRIGAIADFLKALIKLSAAGVKLNIMQPKNADDHFARAIELLQSIGQDEFLGFSIPEMIKFAHDKKLGPILPRWAP